MREYVEPILDDGTGPIFPYLPIAPVLAETPGQAKRMFLDEFANRGSSGVYGDDWTSLRVRLLAKDITLVPWVKPGVHEEADALWALMPVEALA